jgi:hypothetical protein
MKPFCIVALAIACARPPPEARQNPQSGAGSSAAHDVPSNTGTVSPATPGGGPPTTPAPQLTAFERAMERMNARDGKACLEALGPASNAGAPDEMNLREAQTALIRAQCMMLADECTAGKRLYKAAMKKTSPINYADGMLERTTDQVGSMQCEGTMAPRDALLRASFKLTSGASGMVQTDRGTCEQSYKTVTELLPQVAAKDQEDPVAQVKPGLAYGAPNCFARAGDCSAAHAAYEAEMRPHFAGVADAAMRKKALEDGFHGVVGGRCADKR